MGAVEDHLVLVWGRLCNCQGVMWSRLFCTRTVLLWVLSSLMVEQSAGLNLDEYFDLTVDTSGDIESLTGVDELGKDLSTIAWTIIDGELIGEVLTANTVVELESRIRSRVQEDRRVESINELSVAQNLRSATPAVTISVDSIYGTANFSFDP